MEADTLEHATNRLRELLRLKVPDLLLQAECGGGLELPTPLPWGFANVPALYKLADYAERDLLDLRHAQSRVRSLSPEQHRHADEQGRDQEPQHQGTEQQGQDQGPEQGRGGSEGPAVDRASPGGDQPEPGGSVAPEGAAAGGGSQGQASEPRQAGEPEVITAAEDAGAAERASRDARRDSEGHGDDEHGLGRVPEVGPAPEARRPFACGAFLESLQLSRTFRSPHCEVAMAEAMGMMELYDGLAGSTLGSPPSRPDLEALRALLKEHINARWALEAVKQGVAAAKQGNYADAHKAYARALELDPASVEAYVARGAAHANQRAFTDAERDLRHALTLDPSHRNASVYLEAVLRKLEEQRQQLEALEEERQQVLARQTQQQHYGRVKRRQTEEISGTAEGKGGRAWVGHTPGAAVAAPPGRPMGQDGSQGPPSAPGRLQRGTAGDDVGLQPDAVERRRRRASDSSSSDDGTDDCSDSGDSGGGTPGRTASLQPGSDDIRRALEVVLKARKQKKKSKQKSKQKKKHKKSKKRRRD